MSGLVLIVFWIAVLAFVTAPMLSIWWRTLRRGARRGPTARTRAAKARPSEPENAGPSVLASHDGGQALRGAQAATLVANAAVIGHAIEHHHVHQPAHDASTMGASPPAADHGSHGHGGGGSW
jgi:hypothetical protein